MVPQNLAQLELRGLVSTGLMSHTALDLITQAQLLEKLGQWGLGNHFWHDLVLGSVLWGGLLF